MGVPVTTSLYLEYVGTVGNQFVLGGLVTEYPSGGVGAVYEGVTQSTGDLLTSIRRSGPTKSGTFGYGVGLRNQDGVDTMSYVGVLAVQLVGT